MTLEIAIVISIPIATLFSSSEYKAPKGEPPKLSAAVISSAARRLLYLVYFLWSLSMLAFLLVQNDISRAQEPFPSIHCFVAFVPYRYVRNPITVVSLVYLVVDRVLLGDAPMRVYVYLVLVFAILTSRFKYFDEPYMKNFCWTYDEYRRNVSRWIPRLTPYSVPVYMTNPNECYVDV